MKIIVSNLRAALKSVGVEISFGDTAEALVRAGICERVNNGIAFRGSMVENERATMNRSIVQAVKLAVARGGFDYEWRDEKNIGTQLSRVHNVNENFAIVGSSDERSDFYCMWHYMRDTARRYARA